MARADERYSDDPTFHDIGKAQKRVFCGAEAIVRLVLEGKLQRVGKRKGVSRYRSLLVDAEEVAWVLERPMLPGLSLKYVATALSSNLKAVQAIVWNGGLIYTVQRHQRINRTLKIVSSVEFGRFDAKYISLKAATEYCGRSPRKILSELDRGGVSPAFPRPMTFDRRSEVDLLKLCDDPQRYRTMIRQAGCRPSRQDRIQPLVTTRTPRSKYSSMRP